MRTEWVEKVSKDSFYEGCIEDLAVLVAMRHWAGQCPGDAGWHLSALTGREALSAAHEMTLTLTLTFFC